MIRNNFGSFMINPDVCITTGKDTEKSGHQGKIELKTCRSKHEKIKGFACMTPMTFSKSSTLRY